MMQSYIPNTPEEVIDIWLRPHSTREGFGWPPKPDSDWRYVLREQNGFEYLKSLTWQKKTIEISPDIFVKEDLDIVVGLFKAHVLKHQNMFSNMSDSIERIENCCSYLKEHGVFPRPVILEETAHGFKILDGNHRILAMMYLYGYFNVESPEVPNLNVHKAQNVWVASK
jgi:hypothetical protein